MTLAPGRVDYLPMIDRPVIRWPNKAKAAFGVAPNIEHYEYLPPLDGVRNPWPRSPLPDAQQYSAHEYGDRVGFWRLLREDLQGAVRSALPGRRGHGALMCIAFHPYAMGRPHRARYLAEVLDYIMSHDRVWQATTDEIAEHYLAHYYDQAVAPAARLNA